MTKRLDAVGAMAAGLQHEINNPLASVVANLEFALDALRATDAGALDVAEIIAALEDASEGAERVRHTVEDLRHFICIADAVGASVELTSPIENALRVTAHAVRHHAGIRREYGKAPRVRAGEGQLARVFMNLLLSAAQATGDGGADRHTIVLTTRTDDAGRAVAEIKDDGEGLSPEALERIFDPSFLAHGCATMSLGLASCHGIVTSLGGELEVESELGHGTTFRVSLPSADSLRPAAPERIAVTPPSSSAKVGRARVLVIDDDAAIGKAIHRILAGEYDVTLEADARAALDRLRRETYEVVFCDLIMPNMSGMDFFEQILAHVPAVAPRIVFLTGGAFSPRSADFLRKNPNICVAKPFSHEAVSSAARRTALPQVG